MLTILLSSTNLSALLSSVTFVYKVQMLLNIACLSLGHCTTIMVILIIVPVLAVQTFPLQLELMNEQAVACHLSKADMVFDSAQNSLDALSMPVFTLKDVD